MQRSIVLGGTSLTIMIRRHRLARALRLSVLEDGTVRVTLPFRAGLYHVDRFVQEKSSWILDALTKQRASGTKTRAEKAAEFKTHRKLALMIARQRVAHYAPLLGVTPTSISIRNQRTRWGSCSRDGKLCFNYRIALMSLDLADYLIVHELCHMLEFNHSRAFWEHVLRVCPKAVDYREALKNIFRVY